MARDRRTPRQWASEHLEHLDEISITKIVPSGLTLLGLCSGATAINYAINADWKGAVIAILFAMLFDMLDGRAARMLGADSRFGAQLDSLADLVSFGLAPAIIVYTWSLSQMGDAGWIAALVFCVCSAIRLARFNVQTSRDEGAQESHPYFTGLPTPAAAGILLGPLLVSFAFGDNYGHSPMYFLALIAFTSTMMVSRIPTPSSKYIHFDNRTLLLTVIAICVAIPFAILVPWATLLACLLLYLVAIAVFVFAPKIDEDEADPALATTARRGWRRRRTPLE